MEAVESVSCLNCGAVMNGAYCEVCGQKKPHTDLTLKEFLGETTEELTHLEGKVPQTLKTLFFKPGRLTLDFLAGRRARWLPPLRLYLICSLAFFVSKPLVEAVTHRSAREMARITITDPGGGKTLTPETREAIEKGLPARIFGMERLERAATNSMQLNKVIDVTWPKAMFVLLPVFAMLTMVAWRRRMPRYPAHLYQALHLHAAWFGALAVATVASAFLNSNAAAIATGVAALAYIVWYTFVALRRVFGDSWPRTLAKGVVIALAYFGCMILVSLMLLGYALMTM